MRIRHILVAIGDLHGSPRSVLRKAGALARAARAEVELFHAMNEPDPERSSPETAALAQGETLRAATVQRYERRLERLARDPALRGVTVSCSASWDYPPHEAIIRRALAMHSGLVIAATRSRRFGARLLLRNTDWELIRHCPAPLLIVKSPRPLPPAARVGGGRSVPQACPATRSHRARRDCHCAARADAARGAGSACTAGNADSRAAGRQGRDSPSAPSHPHGRGGESVGCVCTKQRCGHRGHGRCLTLGNLAVVHWQCRGAYTRPVGMRRAHREAAQLQIERAETTRHQHAFPLRRRSRGSAVRMQAVPLPLL